ADSSAGIAPPPGADFLSASCADRLNEWAEQTRPKEQVANRERQRAVNAYNISLHLAPGDWTVWVKLGKLYAQMEEPDKMKAAFDEALRLHPNDVSILTSLGEGYEYLREHNQAVQVFRDAVRLQPRNADLWVGLANVLKQTDTKEAVKALQRA